MIETYVTYLLWDGCGAPGNLECNGRRCGEIVDAVPFDRDALLALADEMENNTWYETGFDRHIAVRFARRIREALGVES